MRQYRQGIYEIEIDDNLEEESSESEEEADSFDYLEYKNERGKKILN